MNRIILMPVLMPTRGPNIRWDDDDHSIYFSIHAIYCRHCRGRLLSHRDRGAFNGPMTCRDVEPVVIISWSDNAEQFSNPLTVRSDARQSIPLPKHLKVFSGLPLQWYSVVMTNLLGQ